MSTAVSAPSVFTMMTDEVLSAAARKAVFVAPCDGKIVGVSAASLTTPVGASIILDVNKGGTTIFTTQANRPTIVVTQTTATVGTPEVVEFSAGDVFTVDVDQVGSGTAGTGFTVSVAFVGKTAYSAGVDVI
jgi:hypothetical protein